MFNKIIKYVLLALILIGAALAVWGFAVGFNDASVNVLLRWAYVMVIVGIGLIVALGLIMGAINNPKSLIKTGLVIVGAAVVVAIAFLTAKGAPAQGFVGQQPEFTTLRNTDAILTITYLVFGASIVAIILGMVVNAIRSK
ncbi:MAG: hypothetical protein IAB99_07970 [Bacteroidetes bacterium]|uniref:Transmembrane protein n=1 Tax=Candidatus Cryptobacteroides faecipullorum TaxID=2840764 RepID=A0A9D9I9J5_9BACT|nr:hypothetical protein [Candidatus Cryptobacteroides faecipullorum]